MKLPAILFFGAFAAMFALDFLFNYRPAAEFKEMETEHPQVIEFLNDLDNPVDATAQPDEVRRFSMGFISRVNVNPGFRIVHDPSMGKEITVSGPASALDLLSVYQKKGQLEPEFLKPVRLGKLVEIRVNLHAHGSHRMRINCTQEKRRTSRLPVFATAGPLQFQFLELVNLSAEKVEVETKDLLVLNSKHIGSITGQTKRLEIMYEHPEVPKVTLPGVVTEETIRSNSRKSAIVDREDTNQQQTIDSLLLLVRTLQNDTMHSETNQ